MAKQVWKPGTLVAPIPPMLVSCGTMDAPNIITAAWCGNVNSVPAKAYVSIRPERYSYDLIKESGEFVLNLPTERLLKAAGAHTALAESCTGGLLAQRITTVSGASEVFHCGIVSYSEEIKQKLLGVRAETVAAHTVYSAPVAAQMARGAAVLADAEYGVGITGIAGPTGGLPGIPVGTVFIAVHSPQGTFVRHALWTNRSREDIRWRAATAALEMLRRAVLGLSQPDAAPFLFEPDASV